METGTTRNRLAAPTKLANIKLIRMIFMMHLLPNRDQQRQFHASAEPELPTLKLVFTY